MRVGLRFRLKLKLAQKLKTLKLNPARTKSVAKKKRIITPGEYFE